MIKNCLARPLETQASDSTGFRSFKQFIVEWDQSKSAYDKIVVEDPYARCYFAASLVQLASNVNTGLLDYLDKIDKGKLVEVLNVDFIKFSSLDYWLSGRIKYDMMAYQDIPLNLKAGDIEYSSSLEIYKAYEAIVSEMAVNFNKVKDTFEHLELYTPVIQQMKEQYSDPFIAYEYAQMKEMYIDPTLKDFLQMQMTACMDLLHSGILNDVLSIRNEEVEAVDEANLYKILSPRSKIPANLKELWAKLKKFIEKKEDYLIVPNRDKLLKYVLKHKDILSVDHIRAVFKFDNVMMLIHQDMEELLKEQSSMSSGPLAVEEKSVEKCFRFSNDFARIQIDAMVNGAYQGSYANLALAEITLFHHRQLKKRNSHKAFVMALKNWGIIDFADAEELDRIVSGVRDKYCRLPEEGYLDWSDNFKNDRLVCERMGEKLGPTMPYQH
jgi:hypothetical protein